MKKSIWLLGICALLFFGAGVGWGIWSRRVFRREISERRALRVLCADGWLSNGALENFSHRHGVAIEQWTYANPSEFLRQLANADGDIDVICTSSVYLQSLIHSQWVRKADFSKLANAQLISVDFTHLPFDMNSEYSVPVFWNLYGLFGKVAPVSAENTKQIVSSRRIGIWSDEMNLLQLMKRLGFKIETEPEEAGPHQAKVGLEDEVRKFTHEVTLFISPTLAPFSAEAYLNKVDYAELPLARVARLLEGDTPYHFWLPEDGSAVEVGLFTVGAKSAQPDLALKLINELISSEHALEVHSRLDNAVVHNSLAHLGSVAALQAPEALRRFPLNRLRFPQLNLEDLPRFQKAFAEARAH